MLEELIKILESELYPPTNDFQKGFKSGLVFCIKQAKSLSQSQVKTNNKKKI